jgi:hypothetical protein
MYRITKFYVVAWVGLSAALLAPPGYAHTSLADCLQHRIRMKVNPVNMDIKIRLTFYALRSLPIRQQIDIDHDGVITKTEVQTYLQDQENFLSDALALWADDREVAVSVLYRPEMDLEENNTVGPFPLELRLFYFARTPEWIHSGSIITFADRLWSDIPAVRTLDVSGEQGIQTAITSDSSELIATDAEQSGQRWSIRCTSPSTDVLFSPLQPQNPLSDPVMMRGIPKNKFSDFRLLVIGGIGLFIMLAIGYERWKRFIRFSER